MRSSTRTNVPTVGVSLANYDDNQHTDNENLASRQLVERHCHAGRHHDEVEEMSSRDLLSRLVLAGLLTGVVDGLFSSVLNVFAYGSSVSRLFQGVRERAGGQRSA